MAWRIYARRQVTGQWLHNDVPLNLSITEALNGADRATGTIAAAFDRPAADGLPMWLERATTIYAERDDRLSFVGLCSFTRPTAAGRELEFRDLLWGFDLMQFEGALRKWNADPYDLVTALVADGQSQPDGNLGFGIVRDGLAPERAGDTQPPAPPTKPPRKKGESRDDYDDRLFKWEKAYDDWEAKFGDLEPYSLYSWEAQYVGDEIRELAEECRFEFRTRHRWLNRAAQTSAHDLILSPAIGERRTDVALIEGRNMTAIIDPKTSIDTYGNNFVVLGAGDGSAMQTARFGRRDGRVRTTRFVEAKTVRQKNRLATIASREHQRGRPSVTLDSAQVTAKTAESLRAGDEVHVTSRTFNGWVRISEITRQTAGATADLRFVGGSGSV